MAGFFRPKNKHDALTNSQNSDRFMKYMLAVIFYKKYIDFCY